VGSGNPPCTNTIIIKNVSKIVVLRTSCVTDINLVIFLLSFLLDKTCCVIDIDLVIFYHSSLV
jgi:hypothetical protein